MPSADPITPPPGTPTYMHASSASSSGKATPLSGKGGLDFFAVPKTKLEHFSGTAAEGVLDVMAISTKILNVICRYRLQTAEHLGTRSDEGFLKFLAIIYSHVKAGRAVPMCLPAFPFKSPNTESKVLGRLPDKAEEFSLAHLNGLCAAIKDVYAPGAKLTIVSDGLVYSDLLGVPDREVWAYGQELRAMATAKGFEHIKFSRLQDLVHINVPDQLDEITYVANSTSFRSALVSRFGRSDWDASREIAQSEDVRLTYRGYIRFLSTDLLNVYPVSSTRSKTKFKSGIEYVAKQMLGRGDAFARAVRENFRDHVRLSIHPSTEESKISISLLPTESRFTTPWHCSVAFHLDGSLTSGHRADFDADPRYELVYEAGRASHYRDKALSALLDWAPVVAEPMYPCGMLIRPAADSKVSIEQMDGPKMRALAEHNSPVLLRGFRKSPNRDLFVRKAHELGTPTPWKFGLVLDVKDQGTDTRGLNNVLSAEWMPFHFDGLFKTEKHVGPDGEVRLVPVPPRFQCFTGATASPPKTGYTLFSASARLWKYLPASLPLSRLEQLTWSVDTTSFESSRLRGLPLVQPHPALGRPCLRYHEPWPESKTAFEATLIEIEAVSEAESADICATLDSLLHDRRVCYWHSWQKGDLVISDNVAMMHTRSDFVAGCDRELWRIHFD